MPAEKAQPKFVQRLARLPEVINVIASYPAGISIGVLAGQFGVAADVLHQDLVAFMELESLGWDHGVFEGRAIEFVGEDWDPATDDDVFEMDLSEGDPGALVVKVVDESPTRAMGVEHLSAGDLALLYSAGLACLDANPDDQHLADALEVIAETMYGESPDTSYSPAEWSRLLPLLQGALEHRQQVDIVYSRTWSPGVTERSIEPLRLVQTQRGWEVDAGPVQEDGNLRTYLLSNIRSAAVTEARFDEPSNLEHRLEKQRRTTQVRLSLEQHARWAADMYAEKVKIWSEDELTFECDLELLPPAAERAALLLLASGGEARVLENHPVGSDAVAVIEGLIAHHEALRPPERPISG